MKETREQYLARKQEARARRLAWEKRRDERAAKRKAEAMEEANAQYNARCHLTGAQLKAIKSTDLIPKIFETEGEADRNALANELFRRTVKRAKKDGVNYTVPENWNFNDIKKTYPILCGRTGEQFTKDFEFMCTIHKLRRTWADTLQHDADGNIKNDELPNWPASIIEPIKSHMQTYYPDLQLDITKSPEEHTSAAMSWDRFDADTKSCRAFISYLNKKYLIHHEEVIQGHVFYA